MVSTLDSEQETRAPDSQYSFIGDAALLFRKKPTFTPTIYMEVRAKIKHKRKLCSCLNINVSNSRFSRKGEKRILV